MSAALDYSAHYGGGVPSRKPLPNLHSTYPTGVTGNDQMFTRQPAHSHARSTSTSTVPPAFLPSQPPTMQRRSPQPPQMQSPMPVQNLPPARRTLSNATSSTTSSANLSRAPTNPASYASSIRRSTSSRSNGASANSYVALMRKQKATVWCDRAQHDDPRLLAQQRAAKMRANMEVVGGVHATSRISSSSSGGLAGGVRSKIRHHGAPKASAYSGGGNMSGAGVPMRLSASEVDEGESDDDIRGDVNGRYHQRNGSGRSSLGSGHRVVSYAGQPAGLHSNHQGGRFSDGSTPPSGPSYSPVENASINDRHSPSNLQNLPSPDSDDPHQTPMPDMYTGQTDYFQQEGSSGKGGSGSSEERNFGGVSGLPVRQQQEEKKTKTSDELRRRGSVDDRTMTMSGVRLFVANPDLSD